MGNGRAISVLAAREGAAVACADRDAGAAEATAALVTKDRAAVAFAALAAADTLLAATGHNRPRWLTKPLLMPVLMAGRDRPVQRALALGGAGDVALLGGGGTAFTAGLVSFLAGHVAWIIALRQRPGGGCLRARPVLAAPHLAAFGALNACLWTRTGKHRVPVLAYSTCRCWRCPGRRWIPARPGRQARPGDGHSPRRPDPRRGRPRLGEASGTTGGRHRAVPGCATASPPQAGRRRPRSSTSGTSISR